MSQVKVAVGSLGGTVSMTADAIEQGVVPKLSAEDLVRSVPGLQAVAEITATSLFQVPSSYLDFETVLHSLAWAKAQIAAGAAGVVLTQGTDTLEETAFLCDLFWDLPEPLVLTGAMRPPQKAGAEGPANLLAAVLTAGSIHSRQRGVQVVMNDTIHEARWVRKTHTAYVNAFESAVGAAGMVFEQGVQYYRAEPKRLTFAVPSTLAVKVMLWESTLGDDGSVLDWAVSQGVAGLVIGAFGAGHVADTVANRLEALVGQVPVLVCSRTGGGSTAYQTYGYIGAEMDLQERGVIMGGWLCPRKARLLLWAVLANRLPISQVHDYLATLTH